MSHSHQDFEPTVFHKRGGGGTKKQQDTRAARNGTAVMTKKFGSGGNSSKIDAAGGRNTKTLDEDTETLKHKTVSMDFRKALAAARMAKKMTQKELATAINMKPQIVASYESGKAIPNPQLISKMERALGCKLPRDKKKKKVAAK